MKKLSWEQILGFDGVYIPVEEERAGGCNHSLIAVKAGKAYHLYAETAARGGRLIDGNQTWDGKKFHCVARSQWQ